MSKTVEELTQEIRALREETEAIEAALKQAAVDGTPTVPLWTQVTANKKAIQELFKQKQALS